MNSKHVERKNDKKKLIETDRTKKRKNNTNS